MQNDNINLIGDSGFNRLKKSKYGYCLYNKHDMYVGKSIDLCGEYCEDEAGFLAQICKPGDTVVEVGANIGTHTVMMAKKVGFGGKVFAFEPQRIVYQALCANIALNSLRNVYAFNKAVGAKEGHVYIPSMDYESTNNFGGVSVKENIQGEKIQLVKLDDFLEIDSCKLIKIDVEGMEIDVLKGAVNIISKFSPILYLENDRVEKSKELIEYLWSLDYELYWHLPKLFNVANFYEQKENLIGNFISINMLCIDKKSDVKIVNMTKVIDSSYHPSSRK